MQSCSKSLKFSIYSFDTILWNLENSPVLPYFLSRAVATTLPSLGQIFFPSGTLFFPPQCKLGQFLSLPAVGVLWLFFSSNMQTFCKLQTSLQHMTTDSALCRRLQLGTLLQLLRWAVVHLWICLYILKSKPQTPLLESHCSCIEVNK